MSHEETSGYAGASRAGDPHGHSRHLSPAQTEIVREYVELHQLDESQISFEGVGANPIFDYEAVCALSVKLTDIQSIGCEITGRDYQLGIITARCTVTLPDGRQRISEDSAQLDDAFADGRKIGSLRLAEMIAQARAVRRGIRSVGINLHRAHEAWKKNGQPAAAHLAHDPRQPQYAEIHTLAAKIGLISGANKTLYQNFIAETYDGRTSAKDLNDVELQRLLITLRAMARIPTAPQAA